MFQSQYIWMNGRLVDYQNATLHFLTAGLHYGIGVFEGIRCYATDQGPAVFRLKDHMQRLLHSAAVLGWRELPFTIEQLMEGVKAVVAANGLSDCYVRPLVYLAEGGWNLNIDTGRPYVGIAVWKWDAYLGKEAVERGVRANTSSFTRHHVNASMSKAKICGNYVNSVWLRLNRYASVLMKRFCSTHRAMSPSALEKIFLPYEGRRWSQRRLQKCWKGLHAIL